MSCILKITDPLLKSILGKGEFKTIDELRVTFDDVANKHSILPLNINPPSKGFDIQKFGKVYKEGDEIKVQIVLPGQEYFSQFNLSNRLPEEMREVSFYGDTDDKTLTFDSLDSFLGFYLANFLYVTDTNYIKLAKGVTNILENVVGRLQGKTFKHAGAIEDLLFADSLVNYSKLLYNYAGLEEPPVINQVYELIKDKWDRYHKNEIDQNKVKEKAEQNVQTFIKSDVKANLFFQAFDYVNGKENTKPLAQARRNLIRAIQDPSKYSVKLVQGSVTQAQQTDDNGNYPTIEMIERGTVGILIDENGNQLYLNKNNELTPNREEAISIDYEVDGEKKSSPEITLPFLNVHKPLKEEFLKASPQQKETYIFKVENIKTQIEEKTFAEFNEVGKVEDILINIIADDPYAGISYLMKDGKQIIVDSTPLNEQEIQEVVELLEHTYEPDVLEKVVAYLNDLISVSDERVRKEKTGKEIAFFPAVDRIWVMPLRIKEGDTYQSVESEPIDIRENKELILKALRAARVRFRKGEGASLQTSWSKWKIVDGVPKSFSVKRDEGIKFYQDHIKKVKVDQKTSSQIATFNQRALPTKDKEKEVVIGLLKVVKGKSYTIGEINQLVSPTFLEPEKTIWTTLYNNSKVTPRFVFDDYPESFPAYYDPNTNVVHIKYSKVLENIQTEKAFLGRALTEELLHAVTIPLLNQYKDTVEYQRLYEDYEKAKELAKTYYDTDNYNKLGQGQKEKMDKVVNYYLQSFEEFVVGISHPYFRSFLTLGESRGLLEDIIDKVKKLLNKILKDVAPSLYTDVTTDLFNFIAKKPTELTPVQLSAIEPLQALDENELFANKIKFLFYVNRDSLLGKKEQYTFSNITSSLQTLLKSKAKEFPYNQFGKPDQTERNKFIFEESVKMFNAASVPKDVVKMLSGQTPMDLKRILEVSSDRRTLVFFDETSKAIVLSINGGYVSPEGTVPLTFNITTPRPFGASSRTSQALANIQEALDKKDSDKTSLKTTLGKNIYFYPVNNYEETSSFESNRTWAATQFSSKQRKYSQGVANTPEVFNYFKLEGFPFRLSEVFPDISLFDSDILSEIDETISKILEYARKENDESVIEFYNKYLKKEFVPIIEQTQISTAPESTSSVTFLQESLDLKIWKEVVDSGKYFTIDESDKERPIQYSDNPIGLYIFSTSGEESYEDIKSEVFERIVYRDDKEYTEVLSVQNLLERLEEDTSSNEKLRLVTYLKRLNKYLPGYFDYYLNQIQADDKLQKQIYNQSKVEQIFNFSYLPGTQGAEKVYTINYDNNLIGYAVIDNGNQIRWITIRDQYEGIGLATKLINEIRKDDPKVKFKITLINNPQIFKISERLGGKKISETSVELPAFTAKPIELEFVQREVFVPQQARLFEPEVPLKKREKKSTESKEIKKYYTIPTIPENSEIDLTLIQGIDAEIGKTLFSSGAFADFVQKNVETESVWQRMVNDLKEEYNELMDAPSSQDNEERLDWIDLFLENEIEIKRQWIEKSNLFVFNNEKIYIEEDELQIEEEEEAEKPEHEQGKDIPNNKVDSEQKYTRLQLGDPYAKILVKLTPIGRVKGLTQLADFTNLWNRLQNLLANTISFDEQVKILSNPDNLVIVPEAPVLVERLESIPKDVNGAIIINNFQRSFGTAQLPVYNTYFTKTDNGYDYSFFESAKLDVQNLEMLINQGFNEFAESWKTTVRLEDREIPTYDLKQFLTFLEKSKDLVETYRQLGFPIPVMDKDRFIREAGLANFHAGLIQIIKNRIGKWNGGESKNTIILNGDLLTFIKGAATWVEFGNNIGTSPGLATLANRFTSTLAKYSPLTVSNMTKNAENQNQSILLSWSSWLISVKQLNDGESYRSKNPIFKYSLLSQLVDTDNQITPINLMGQRIQDGTGWEGTVSMSQNFIDYVRQEISNMMLSGTGEILRAETKQSSFGYRFKWRRESNNMHPVMLENFKTDKWVSDVSDIYIGNKNEDVLKGYLKGEFERIEIEKNNPVIYYPKYEKIKGDFHLFTFLSDDLKKNLVSLSPQEAVDKYRNKIKEELINHFNNLVSELKQEVFNQTGLPLTVNHPVLNVTQIQEKIKELGFENFLRAFVVNRDIYQTEHFITGHGDVGQHDKPYKRFGSNISTGTPVAINEITNEVLENTKHKQFRERIPTGRSFVITDDIYSYDNPNLVDDIEKSLTESYKRFGLDKTPKEIREEAVKKASKYLKTNVADGQGFMTPDFGRLVMIATGTWTHDREKGFWFQKIQHKRNKGIPLEAREQEHYDKVNEEIKERGIFWFFPPLKMQYRGEFIPIREEDQKNVAIEGLDKFSLAWLWPDEMEGRVFEPILNKMMDEGYDYGKFESGTKIGTFKPDNLLQEIRNGNVDVTIESGHDIDLAYMKEQVRAADKFKDKMPMSTQARKLVLSNLRFNGEYLSESIGEAATEWKQSQAEISEKNVLGLMDKISTDGQIDNKKLADEIKEELKKRELPQSLTSIFTLYGDEFYQRFEQSLSPQLVETLIYSLLKNKVVRPKFPGEHYIMMSSSLFDRESRELGFYELGDETKPAQCKVVLSGEFLKLLNVKEITDYINSPEVKPVYDQLSPYEQIENKRELLNQLLLNPVFVEKYKDSLTVFSSRIPGQGYNSMDIMTIQEFLPTYMGAVLVPYAQMTTKVGADFDFDKIPTITPELTKTGKAKDSKVNRMLNAASKLILDPVNFHRLVTPNTTDNIDEIIENTLRALGEDVSEPRFDKIFSFTTHLRKWMATKMKDALGIGATNNTFYTLLQDADAKLNKKFTIGDGWGGDVKFPFEREDKPMSYPLLQSGIDKLEFVNEFINITVDVASNDAIGYTGLKRDNSALLLFLLENGVDFADAFYFINQPIIIKYHQLLNQFKDQGYTSTEAKNLSISKLLGIVTQIDGGQRVQAQIYGEIDSMIKKDKFSNLLSTIARKDEVDKKWNTATQKEYLAYYLIGLEMANKMREAQSYNNFDTRPSPNLLYSQARENSLEQIRFSGLFDLESIQKIHNDSVISHLNVHDEFKRISEVAFKIKRDPRFTTQSLGLSEYIYDQKDKESFFKKFDNDYLLAILQNYGTIDKDKVEKNLKGELVEKWNKIKNEVKDLTISKYIVTNYSTKTPYSSLTLFLGLDGDSLTLDQIAKDLRVMLNSPNKEVKEFAKDFIETGLYTTGFTQSPVYYLKALPFEVVNKYLKEAYDNYEKLSPLQQQRFIGLFSDRFMFQRGMQFGQYWITLYKKVFNIKNLDFKTKQLKFNQEAWRYTDYKLSLEELNQPDITEMNQPAEFTNHSGGAPGADTQWDLIGQEYGVINRHYYIGTKSEKNAPRGNVDITNTPDAREGAKKVAQAAKQMWGYKYDTMKDERLIRNWAQVKYSDAVYAISTIGQKGDVWKGDEGKVEPRKLLKQAVQGGTGYAVEMAIQQGKPVYVFDQKKDKWFTWNGSEFVETKTPVLTKNFAGIGTREINETGKQAIRDVYKKTMESQPVQQPKQLDLFEDDITSANMFFEKEVSKDIIEQNNKGLKLRGKIIAKRKFSQLGSTSNVDFQKKLLAIEDTEIIVVENLDYKLTDGRIAKPLGTTTVDSKGNRKVYIDSKANNTIVLHEMVHYHTSRMIDEKPNNSDVKKLKQLFNYVKENSKDNAFYGLKNVHEFISEAFTNPEFAKHLQTVPYKATNILDWFVDIIASLLGVKRDVTYQIYNTGMNIIEAQQKLTNLDAISSNKNFERTDEEQKDCDLDVPF